MRGLVVAVCFFIVTAALAFTVQKTLEKTSDSVIEGIDSLRRRAESGAWSSADEAMKELERELYKTSKWIAMFVDHSEIDMIITSFSALSEYERYREMPELMAELSTLRELIGHIPAREALSLENIL